MEARLAKMRVTGLRYDSDKIHTGDMKYDFTITNWMPGHAANILRNGGGKGVWNHCLFQTLDPLTSWNGDANKVSHFFFNSDERPIEYTFHIVQEWWISLEKRVMLGISVTPRLSTRESKKETSSPIELDYFLYISEPAMDDELDIFDFPLWDEQEKEAKSYAEWKQTLNQDGRFVVYHKHQREEYLAKIEEFGYDANTINTLKSINIGEGSLVEYFKGATDNTGLFFHHLIPTLNDKIEGIDSRNKREFSLATVSFLDTLKIAKELPDLMAMVDSIEQINDHILPLKDTFREGEELKENFENWQNKGKELYQLLKTLQDAKEIQVRRLKADEEKRQSDLQIANWKFRNVEYIEIHQKRDVLDGEYFELEEKQMKEDLALKRLKTNLDDSKVNLEVRKRNDRLQEIANLAKRIQTMLESENVQALTKEMEDIKSYFQSRWDDIFARWQKEMNQNHRSALAHTDAIRKTEECIQDERSKESELTLEIHDLDNTIKGFEIKLKDAAERYDSALPYTFVPLIEETIQLLKSAETKLEEEINNKKTLEQNRLNTQISMAKQEQSIQQLEKEIEDNGQKIIHAQETEKGIVTEAARLLKAELPQENDRDGFHALKTRLQQFLSQKREAHQAELLKMWTVQEDSYLIEEGEKIDAYIPNADLLKVKRLLDAHNIESLYGSEYLNQLSVAEAKRELEKNPALRYSVVVVENSFESLNFSFIQDEILRNYVVLIDKKQSSKKEKLATENPYLSKHDEMNYLLKDRSHIFTEDKYELEQWKSSIEKRLDDAEIEMSKIEENILKTEDVLKNITVILSGKVKLEWEQEGLRLQNEKGKWEQALQNANEHLIALELDIEDAEASIHTLTAEKESLLEKEKELVRLQQEYEDYQSNQSTRARSLEYAERARENIDRLEKDKDFLVSQNNSNHNIYSNWMDHTRKNFNTLKGMLTEIYMPRADTTLSFSDDDLAAYSFPRSLCDDDYYPLQRYRDLNRDLSNTNLDIAELKTQAKDLNEKVTEIELQLQELAGDEWKTVSVPEMDEVHLRSIVSQYENSMKEAEKRLASLNGDMRLKHKLLEETEKQLAEKKEEIDQEFYQGAQYVELKDCKEAREKYRSERNRLNKESGAARSEIGQFNRAIADVENTVRLLESLSLSSQTKVLSLLTDEEKARIMTSPMEYYTVWTQENNKATNLYRFYQENLGKRINRIKDKIENFTNIPLNYQRELVHFLSVIRDMSFDEASKSLDNYLEWAQNNLQDELEQKEKADKAVDLYVDRQSRRVLEIIHALQDLVRKMAIVNWKGERVHLVKYNKNYMFPNNLDEIRYSVKEFCLNEIDYYVQRGKDRIDALTVADVARTVNISKLTLKVLGDFPKLYIHIPGLEGGLLRGEEKYLTYKEWETINHGSSSSPTKSGGQTLLAQIIVLAMIMRQRVDGNSSLFLVSDNPFGKMSAPELVEAAFSLLDLLNIQWIVVAPPITNVHITSKFPTIHFLSLQVEDGKQILTQKLVKNYRKYLENISVLENQEEDLG